MEKEEKLYKIVEKTKKTGEKLPNEVEVHAPEIKKESKERE